MTAIEVGESANPKFDVNADIIGLLFRRLRWRLGLLGFAALVPIGYFLPYSRGLRGVQVAGAGAFFLQFALLWKFSDSTYNKQRFAWVVVFIVDTGLIWGIAIHAQGGAPGTYAVSFVAYVFMWSGGLLLPRQYWAISYCPPQVLALLLMMPLAAKDHPLQFLVRYSFGFTFTLIGTMSINALLRRAYEELEFSIGTDGLRERVAQLVSRRSSELRCNSPLCGDDPEIVRMPSIELRLGDEFLLLLRRRSLDHQFSEWRSRTRLAARLAFNLRVGDRLRLLIDETFGVEHSPLSLLVYFREKRARILSKAAFSTLTQSDLVAPASAPEDDADDGVGVGLENLAFGKIVRIDIPAGVVKDRDDGVNHPIEKSERRRERRYLNDVVGGGIAGDSYRFVRFLLVMVVLYPISVVAKMWALALPPGRSVGASAEYLAWLCVAESVIGLFVFVSLRRDETVSIRSGWQSVTGVCLMLPMLAFACIDPRGSLWNSSGLGAFRFVHPFVVVPTIVAVLIGLWGASSPRGIHEGNKRRREVIAVSQVDARQFGISVVEWRSLGLAVLVVIPFVWVSIIVAGARVHGLNARAAVIQIGLWTIGPLLGALLGSIVLRRAFMALDEVTFEIQCGTGLIDWRSLVTCHPRCFRVECCERAEMICRQWGLFEHSLLPLVLSSLGWKMDELSHGQRVGTLVTDAVKAEFANGLAVLDRVLLAEGMRASTVSETHGSGVRGEGDAGRRVRMELSKARPQTGCISRYLGIALPFEGWNEEVAVQAVG